jgi:hypothetical protein
MNLSEKINDPRVLEILEEALTDVNKEYTGIFAVALFFESLKIECLTEISVIRIGILRRMLNRTASTASTTTSATSTASGNLHLDKKI